MHALLAGLVGVGIDNAVIQLTDTSPPTSLASAAYAPPALDGTALAWMKHIGPAGSVDQHEPRRVVHVRRPVAVTDGPWTVEITPEPDSVADVGPSMAITIDIAVRGDVGIMII
jgi:UDP-3-O-acyl-N-acetylglucosamine deacetylase